MILLIAIAVIGSKILKNIEIISATAFTSPILTKRKATINETIVAFLGSLF